MKEILVGLILGIFFGLNLFADDVDLGIEFANKGDFIKASELFKKACDSGNVSGCYNLGIVYYKGTKVKQDYFKANELWVKACDGGNVNGCYNLGFNYAKGFGVKQDTQKAKELFGKACDLGNQDGCNGYSILNTK